MGRQSWCPRLIVFCELRGKDLDWMYDWLYVPTKIQYVRGNHIILKDLTKDRIWIWTRTMRSDCISLAPSCSTCTPHIAVAVLFDTVDISGELEDLIMWFHIINSVTVSQGLHLNFNIELQWIERSSIDKALWNNSVAYHVTFTERERLQMIIVLRNNKSDCAGEKRCIIALPCDAFSPRLIQSQNRKK